MDKQEEDVEEGIVHVDCSFEGKTLGHVHCSQFHSEELVVLSLCGRQRSDRVSLSIQWEKGNRDSPMKLGVN